MANDKKLGLALGGGGPRGIAHIGFLKAMEDNGIKPDFMTGTSVGALVAALYSFDVPLLEQKEYAQSMTWSTITKIKLSRYALVTNENIRLIITHFLGSKKIEDAKIPLAIIACDIASGDKIVLRSGDVADAIMASSAIPGIFAPVKINDRLLVDGGVIENVPISPLPDMGAEVIVASDLMAKRIKKQPTGVIDIINNSFNIMISHSQQYHSAKTDIVVKPELAELSKVDKETLEKIYEEGRRCGQTHIKNIKELIN